MRPMDVHPSDRDLLSMSDRELSARKQQGVEAHAEGCLRCRTRLAALRGTFAAARDAYDDDGEPGTIDPGANGAVAHGTGASGAADRMPQERLRLQRALRAAAAEPPSRRPAFAEFFRSPGLAAAAVLLLTVSIWGSGVWKPRVGRAAESLGAGATAAPIADAGAAAGTVAGAASGASLSGAADVTMLPLARFTPGAVSIVSAQELCAGRGISRVVTAEIRTQVLRSYDMERVPDGDYELDALITPELGGTTDARNLWPQRYASPIWNARVKDELEQHLAGEVCGGRVDLAVAQRDIAADWVAAYRKYFHTEQPLQAHVGPPIDDHDLVIASGTPTLFAPMRD